MPPSEAIGSRNLRRPNIRNSSTTSDGPQPQSSPVTWWVLLTSSRVVIPLVVIIAIFEVVRYAKIHNGIVTILHEHQDRTFGMPTVWSSASSLSCDDHQATIPTTKTRSQEEDVSSSPKITIAYATSITAYDPTIPNLKLIDRAAVLHQSIRLATQKSLRYDYHIYAFVHPDAVACTSVLRSLGYRVQIRETPFNVSMIANENLIKAQGNGCCGAKEYLKLYSYLLLDYPVVVHLDLDTIVLKSMDQVFDMMTTKRPTDRQRQQFALESSMWYKNSTPTTSHLSTMMPQRIDFMFTRDYNMVDPPRKQVHQMGVQGGFLLLRPSQQDFDDMVHLILSGGDGFTINDGWASIVGGFYGAGTIQGLASYYYGHILNSTRSVELNRCYYNTMVDNPHSFNKELNQTLCTTLEPDLSCENCRHTPLEKVYTAHFTVCGKPEWCSVQDPDDGKGGRLCMELFREWHRIRLSLEMEWMHKFPNYVPELVHVNASQSRDMYLRSFFQGHCRGDQYIPIQFPNNLASSSLSSLIG